MLLMTLPTVKVNYRMSNNTQVIYIQHPANVTSSDEENNVLQSLLSFTIISDVTKGICTKDTQYRLVIICIYCTLTHKYPIPITISP